MLAASLRDASAVDQSEQHTFHRKENVENTLERPQWHNLQQANIWQANLASCCCI